jgi:hypothetical protein
LVVDIHTVVLLWRADINPLRSEAMIGGIALNRCNKCRRLACSSGLGAIDNLEKAKFSSKRLRFSSYAARKTTTDSMVTTLCTSCLGRKFKKKSPTRLIYGLVTGSLLLPGLGVLGGYVVAEGLQAFQVMAAGHQSPFGVPRGRDATVARVEARLSAPVLAAGQLGQRSPTAGLTRD